MHYEYPENHFHLPGPQPLPASYANFLFANQAVFMPTFGQPTDDIALRRLDEALPEHTIVPIRCEHLIVGRGGLHCMTVQQPA
jgi:agmatine/peptidylarginine deiminase